MGLIVAKDLLTLKVDLYIDLQVMLISKRLPNMYFNLIKILTQNTVLFIKMNLIQFIA